MGVYILTSQGLLKMLIMLFNAIGSIVICTVDTPSRTGEWKKTVFLIATGAGFFVSLIVVILRSIDDKQHLAPGWMKIEFMYSLIFGFYVLVASALIIDVGTVGYIAAGVLGLLATVSCLVDIADKIRTGSLRSQ